MKKVYIFFLKETHSVRYIYIYVHLLKKRVERYILWGPTLVYIQKSCFHSTAQFPEPVILVHQRSSWLLQQPCTSNAGDEVVKQSCPGKVRTPFWRRMPHLDPRNLCMYIYIWVKNYQNSSCIASRSLLTIFKNNYIFKCCHILKCL